jgi:hypothetical protein
MAEGNLRPKRSSTTTPNGPARATMGRHAHLRQTSASAGPHMKSLVVKRSVVFAGHTTSVSLEPFWKSLKEIATSRDMSLSDLLAAIDSGRHHGKLEISARHEPGESGGMTPRKP